MSMLESLLPYTNLLGAMALFVIGLHTVVTRSNMIKRILGVNIMGTGVFYFFIAIGNVENGRPPILGGDGGVFINPLPSVLILTGIVVVVSITVYALSLVIRIYETYGTTDQREVAEIQSDEEGEFYD